MKTTRTKTSPTQKNLLVNNKMQQNYTLWIIALFVIWFMFFRNKSNFSGGVCGSCGAKA